MAAGSITQCWSRVFPPEYSRTRVLSVEGCPRTVGRAAISPCAAAGGRTNFTPYWHPTTYVSARLSCLPSVNSKTSGCRWLPEHCFFFSIQARTDRPVMARVFIRHPVRQRNEATVSVPIAPVSGLRFARILGPSLFTLRVRCTKNRLSWSVQLGKGRGHGRDIVRVQRVLWW